MGEPIPIPEWNRRTKIIIQIIDAKIHDMLLSKKIGFPFEEISEEWIKMAADKINASPILIRDEIDRKLKELEDWV